MSSMFGEGVAAVRSELIVFCLDHSVSMGSSDTFDGRTRRQHLDDLVVRSLERMGRAKAAQNFLVSIIYFAAGVEVAQADGLPYFSINTAIDLVRKGSSVPTEATDLVGAISRAHDVVEQFATASELSSNKVGTVLLFTDGEHTARTAETPDIAAQRLKGHVLTPTFGCVRFGGGDGGGVLARIASTMNPEQERSFDKNGMLGRFSNKVLYLDVTDNQQFSDDAQNLIRNFINVLSQTV